MRRSLLNWFILAICITDILILISSFFMFSLPAIAEVSQNVEMHATATFCMRWSYAFAIMSQTANIYFTVLASTHRFIGVCYPFIAQRLIDRKIVTLAIIGTAIFSVAANVPRFFEITLVNCVTLGQPIRKSFNLAPTLLNSNKVYFLAYRTIAYSVMMFAMPFVILIFVNAKIIRALWLSDKTRKQMQNQNGHNHCLVASKDEKACTITIDANECDSNLSAHKPHEASNLISIRTSIASIPNDKENKPVITKVFKVSTSREMSRKSIISNHSQSSRRERSTTTMLLMIVAFFFACNLLPFAMNIIDYVMLIWEDFGTTPTGRRLYLVAVDLGNFMVALNSAMMIFIYYFFGSKFKAIVVCIIKCDHQALDEKEMRRKATQKSFRSTHPSLTLVNSHAQSIQSKCSNKSSNINCRHSKLSTVHFRDNDGKTSLLKSPKPCIRRWSNTSFASSNCNCSQGLSAPTFQLLTDGGSSLKANEQPTPDPDSIDPSNCSTDLALL